jgi:hypothetical protein
MAKNAVPFRVGTRFPADHVPLPGFRQDFFLPAQVPQNANNQDNQTNTRNNKR